MFAILTSNSGNIASLCPNVCLKNVPPPGAPVPIPTPVIKAAGSDVDKGKCPSKVSVCNAKVGTAKSPIRKTSPGNPAGNPPDLKGVVSMNDTGPAKVVRVIASKVSMQGQNPLHVTCPFLMNEQGAPNTSGPMASGENKVTVSPA